MRRLLASFVALAVLAGAAPAADQVTRAGKHFRVVCHFADETIAAAALETVEAVWPIASSLYGLPDAPLDPLLEVHLYRRPRDYLVAERELAGGAFDLHLAFSSFETRSSYVALQPDLTDDALAVIGLTPLTRHDLAHEAVHLVSYRGVAAFRSQPQWVAEGAAIWAEEETLAARGWSAGRDEDPFVATAMVRAQHLLAGGALPSARRILADQIRAMDRYPRYAVQSLLFRRLISRRDGQAFRAALARAGKLPDSADFAERFLATVTEPYAEEGLDGLDLDFEQFVRCQTPAWDETQRALGTAGDDWPQAAFDANAVAWRTAPAGAEPYDVRGSLEILPGNGSEPQMNVLLGRDADDGFVSVGIAAPGAIAVWRYRRRDDRWEKLASGTSAAVQTGKRVPFRVSVAGGRIAVRVDGAEVAVAEMKDRELAGPWGLGVQAGAAGVWHSVRLERTRRER
jgi:hypothetical protein